MIAALLALALARPPKPIPPAILRPYRDIGALYLSTHTAAETRALFARLGRRP